MMFLHAVMMGILLWVHGSPVVLGFTSTAGVIPHTTTRTTSQRRNNNNAKIVLDESVPILELPVFPLRKNPRVVTDTIRLNLYEERYLAMSEYILSSKEKLFGVVYGADKSQLVVQGGRGPIVPMFQKGDVGVLCVVQNSSDGMIPATRLFSSSSKEEMRRRISLDAIALVRFTIQEILSDGSNVVDRGVGSSSNNQQKQQQPPFIMVNAHVVMDDLIINNNNKNDEERELCQRLVEELSDTLQWQQHNGLQQSQEEPSSSSTTTTNTTNDLQDDDEEALLSLLLENRDRYERLQYVDATVDYVARDDQARRQELFSFAAASAILPVTLTTRPIMLNSILSMTSTLQRLEQIAKWTN